jgi:hypothetical protein
MAVANWTATNIYNLPTDLTILKKGEKVEEHSKGH